MALPTPRISYLAMHKLGQEAGKLDIIECAGCESSTATAWADEQGGGSWSRSLKDLYLMCCVTLDKLPDLSEPCCVQV